jgi:hypothetical protein
MLKSTSQALRAYIKASRDKIEDIVISWVYIWNQFTVPTHYGAVNLNSDSNRRRRIVTAREEINWDLCDVSIVSVCACLAGHGILDTLLETQAMCLGSRDQQDTLLESQRWMACPTQAYSSTWSASCMGKAAFRLILGLTQPRIQ